MSAHIPLPGYRDSVAKQGLNDNPEATGRVVLDDAFISLPGEFKRK